MQIKREFEMTVISNRHFVIREPDVSVRMACNACGAPMVTTEQAARVSGIPQRRMFRMIEQDAAHATEMATGAVMICLSVLARL